MKASMHLGRLLGRVFSTRRPERAMRFAHASGQTELPECTIVAIARNELKYLPEWIAHHLAIGASKLIVFDNGSSDGSGLYLRSLSKTLPLLEFVDWPSADSCSPQRSAYNAALARVKTEWICFIDIDEFLVPWRDGSIGAYLDLVPADVAAVHVNWRCFGSNGLTDEGYGSVTSAFTMAAVRDWGNNHHYKTIGRTKWLMEAYIHYATVKQGRRVLSDFSDLDQYNDGLSGRVVHDGIQINHYQSKTFPEFSRRMRGGDANYPDGHHAKERDASRDRFNLIDRNDEPDTVIEMFREKMAENLSYLSSIARSGYRPRQEP